MEFHADSIMQHANFTFVIANDVYMPEVKDLRHYDRETYNLILLHGLTGTDTDWLYGGLAQEMAIQYNLNVFMPTAGNNFYLDKGYPGANWGEYVGCELPEYIEKTFRVKMTRENTLIGGLSMGGFGALHTALAYPETFGRCIALSSGLIIYEYATGAHRDSSEMPIEMLRDVFGDPDKVIASDKNPETLYHRLKEAGLQIPRIYLACGTEDDLLPHSRAFAEFLKDNGADYIYEEGPGKHNWTFWNEYLNRGLDQLL
jgi:S-formylglutathione hydrolase FrmB